MSYSNISITTDKRLLFNEFDFIKISHDEDNYIIGTVVSYDRATGALVFTPLKYAGQGTFNTWIISITGSPGEDGVIGADGAIGSSGTAGTSGSAGTSGTDGTSGSSGTSGTDGTSGSSGTSGTDGTSGSAGTDGTSGSAGTDGTSGSSGTAGSSGTSFSSPYSGNLNVTSGQAWVSADANGNTASSTAVNWNDSNIQTFTLNTATTTFTFSNGNAGATYILIIRQNSSGSQTVIWPASVAWSGASTPTMTSTANRYDVYTFIFDGSKYFGSYVQNFT